MNMKEKLKIHAEIEAENKRKLEAFRNGGKWAMTVDFFGTKVRIPKGFAMQPDGVFIRNTGYEYGLVQYNDGDDAVFVLEPLYNLNLRCFVCEEVKGVA